VPGGKVTVEVIENPVQVTVENTNVDVDVVEQVVVLELGITGPQGPMGEIQPETLGYVHTQSVASDTGTINHNMIFVPNITVIDSGGTVVEGSYNYPNNTTVVLSFSSPFSGKAYLS